MAEELSKAELEEKTRQINQKLFPFTTPLMLLPSISAKPEDIIYTGSGAFVDTGEKRLLITCDHVWQEFLEYRKKHSDSVVGMPLGTNAQSANVIDLPVLDSSKELDITILDLTDFELLADSDKSFAKVESWPPSRPSVGDVLVAIGFPGSERRLVDQGENVSFYSTTLIDDIVSISDRHIGLADEDHARKVLDLGIESLPDGFSFGGVSGCPAFVNRNNGFDFAGIVYESTDDSSGLFFISHASFVREDGTIDWALVPPN